MVLGKTGSSTEHLYLAKLDPSKQLLWVKTLPSKSSNVANSIALDNSGNIVVCGHFVSTTDFDPSSATYNLDSYTFNNSDGFVANTQITATSFGQSKSVEIV